MLDMMKSVTTREFYHSPALVKGLRPGQAVLVTDKGKASFTVVKSGQRPRKTAKELRHHARNDFPKARSKFNFSAWLKKHRA